MIIRSTSADAISDAVWESEWYNANFKSNADKEIAANAPTPKGFIVQVAFDSITGSPGGSSKVQILSTIRGQSETVYFEQAITANNLSDSFLFENVVGNAFKVRIPKGGITDYKAIIDYDVIEA